MVETLTSPSPPNDDAALGSQQDLANGKGANQRDDKIDAADQAAPAEGEPLNTGHRINTDGSDKQTDEADQK